MADKTYVIELDTTQVDASASKAVKAADDVEAGMDRIVDASGRARDAFGRFVAAGGAHTATIQQNVGAIYEFADAYDLVPSKLDAAAAAYKRVNYSADQIVGSWGKATDTFAASTKSLDGNYSSTVKLSQAGQDYVRTTGAARGATSNFGNQLLTLGRLADDVRYGVQGVANNLIEINPLLGIAAIAGSILAKRFGDIQAAAVGTSLEEPINTWKHFFDQNIQKAEEFVGILSKTKDAATAAAKATEAIGKIQSAEEKRTGEAVTKALEQAGGGGLVLAQLQQTAASANPGQTAAERTRSSQLIATNLESAKQGNQEALNAVLRVDPRNLFAQSFQVEFEKNDPALKEAAKVENDRIERESREAEAHNRANEEARKNRVEEAASNITSGPLSSLALAAPNQVGADRIRDVLRRSQGFKASEADEVADAVLGKFQEDIGKAIKKRASEKGITEDAARIDLLKERLETAGKASREGDPAALAQLNALGVSAGDIQELQGPLSKAQTFGSGVELAQFSQSAALDQNQDAKEHTKLLTRIAVGVEKTNESREKSRPTDSAVAVLAGPTGPD